VVVPSWHPLTARRDYLYETVHSSLVAALARWRINATLCRDSLSPVEVPRTSFCDVPNQPTASCRPDQATVPRPVWSPPSESFLCFQRRAPGDVLVSGVKIAGSAQRRRRGAVLQHGSVILRTSPFAPEVSGLAEVAALTIAAEELAATWREVLAGQWQWPQTTEPLSDAECRHAVELVESRYAAPHWTTSPASPPQLESMGV
jgi:lipoate-protein ligase A